MNRPSYFFLRRHAVGSKAEKDREPEDYWYEVMERIKEHPLDAGRDRSVCMVHSETTGRIMVDEMNGLYERGLAEGIRRFAWWKDGCQYVGTCGTRLADALKDL